MTCKFMAFCVSTDGRSPGTARAVFHCTTHQWSFDTPSVSEETLCPLGRIEKATNEAIAKIEAAKA